MRDDQDNSRNYDKDDRDRNSSATRDRGDRRFSSKRGTFKKKVCKFCTQNLSADYKNPDMLRRYVTERGKILPSRITGNCAKHQRALTTEIKRARVLAYLPFDRK
ncbi:MAG: 30S ribosomal protein S18 [Spirochaetia bacterium]|nr:30S ribosomal protein S18 [Spirochaetia bacterium]